MFAVAASLVRMIVPGPVTYYSRFYKLSVILNFAGSIILVLSTGATFTLRRPAFRRPPLSSTTPPREEEDIAPEDVGTRSRRYSSVAVLLKWLKDLLVKCLIIWTCKVAGSQFDFRFGNCVVLTSWNLVLVFICYWSQHAIYCVILVNLISFAIRKLYLKKGDCFALNDAECLRLFSCINRLMDIC